jgi:O-antigen ligase
LLVTALHLPPFIATFIYALGIVGLYWLDRDPDTQVSKVLWLPVTWLLINGSRPVSMWLGMSPSGGTADVYLEGSPIDRVVYLALLFAGIIVLLERAEQVRPLLRANGAILLFFSYAALSIVWSDYPFVTFKHWIKGLGDLVMILVILTDVDPMGALKRLITRVGFLLLPLSVLLCKYYPALARTLSRSWTMEYTGVTTQKNSLGEICLIFGLGVLWRFRAAYLDRGDAWRARHLAALGTVFAMAVWLLWISDSMTSICGLAMASIVMLLAMLPWCRRRPSMVHFLVIVMLSVSIFALFFDTSGNLVQELGRQPTLTGRTEVWSEVLSIPVNRIVGAGYESFWLGNRLEQMQAIAGFGVNEAHNGYLEMYLNLGWIGVAVLAVVLGAGYRHVIREYRREPDYGSLRVAYFLSALIINLTEAGFRMMAITWFALLLVTVAVPKEFASDESTGNNLAQGQLEVEEVLVED